MNNLNGDSDSVILRIERLMKIMVKLKLEACRGEKTQNDMIFLLDGMGCSTNEIADLLGASRNSVGPVLSRAKNKGSGVKAR